MSGSTGDDGKRRWKGPSDADRERVRERTFSTKKKTVKVLKTKNNQLELKVTLYRLMSLQPRLRGEL